MNSRDDDKTEVYNLNTDENSTAYQEAVPYQDEYQYEAQNGYQQQEEYTSYSAPYQVYSTDEYTNPYTEIDIESLEFDNLPEDATSNNWVQRPYYDALHESYRELLNETSEYHYAYHTAYKHNESLVSDNNALQNELNTRSTENEAAKARNEKKERELLEKEQRFEDERIRRKWWIIGLSAFATLMTIALLILGVKYNSEVNKNLNNSDIGTVQQEQLNTMRDSVSKAQQERNDAQRVNQELQDQVNQLKRDLDDSEERAKSAEESLKESNDTLDEMTQKISELSSATPETTTIATTVTEQVQSRSQPVVTTTVEVPASDDSSPTTTSE